MSGSVKCVYHAMNNPKPCPKDAVRWTYQGGRWYALCEVHTKSVSSRTVPIDEIPAEEKCWACHHQNCVTSNGVRAMQNDNLQHAYDHGYSFGQSVTEEEVQATVLRLQALLS